MNARAMLFGFLAIGCLGAALAGSIFAPAASAQEARPPAATAPATRPASAPETKPAASAPRKASTAESAAIIEQSARFLLEHQEGDGKAEWPYEGVYREKGLIPLGYRIGGTGICAVALTQAPGCEADPERREAVARAARFIIRASQDPLMSPDYDGGYDVRGWGYTYGLDCLVRLKARGLLPDDLKPDADKAIRWFIDAIQKTEIPKVGGWNYARARGIENVSPPSPFMTGPTLQALFAAKAAGYPVDAAVVKRGLDTLETARTPTGSFMYSGVEGKTSREPVPGAVGRMLVSECTLYMAGRSSVASIRGALDAFIVHWQWLDKRRAQNGTHIPPYNIAPYYFYYAHYYAAQAIELLPDQERREYRRRLNELLMSVRLPDGTWNDRVFPRSASFGTAMAMMVMLMPQQAAPAMWRPEPE